MKDFSNEMKTIEGMLSDAYNQGYADGKAAVEPSPTPQPESQPTPAPTPEPEIPQDKGKLLYKVGLISDPHFDIDDKKGTDYTNDLTNALYYFRSQEVAFIASCGDYGEYDIRDWLMFSEYYNAHAWAPSRGQRRLFTATGNHDSYIMTSKQLMGNESKDVYIGKTKAAFNNYTGEDTFKDMHFFEYGGKWDEQRVGERNNQSKLSYWVEKDGVMWVFLSVDYGEDPDLCWGMMTQACNKLDYSDQYVQRMEAIASAHTPYTRITNDPFNYQFYHPNLLVWLYELLEANKDKRIGICMHHFFPQKAGNGSSYTANGNFYSKDRLWPYSDQFRASTTKANSNTLCGLEFWFLNYLCNTHKNTFWISGHSHFCYPDDDPHMAVCRYDFGIYKPDGTEKMVGYGEAENYDNVVFCRVNDVPVCDSAPCIHLPSLSKPADRTKGESIPGASQGGVIEVYENAILLQMLNFKNVGESRYVNENVATFIIS